MPLNPTAAQAAARSAIDSAFGPIPSGLKPAEITALNAARDELAQSIASMSGYIGGNAQVNAGIPVSTTGSATAQTGATTSPGSLS